MIVFSACLYYSALYELPSIDARFPNQVYIVLDQENLPRIGVLTIICVFSTSSVAAVVIRRKLLNRIMSLVSKTKVIYILDKLNIADIKSFCVFKIY